ncbi:DUF397 domain-containing protein [Cryptosporangium aurantiacum]|uniref:DUF397 domain-containing protein n=1 Tax=Cryptosporangium aurantiacum TaxID=134849 RepID=A0A1M7MYR4_9ACTN|nr:DUF397 domain-containing protein [Cryptosporangium aurantiacum]SHM95793.1 protein of unknown function [Cryptosporangium aurantiacum]
MPQVDLSAAEWLRSSRSADDDGPTVEVAFVGDQIAVRDSTDPDAVLLFTQAEWDAFLAGVNGGEFDLDEEGELAN